MKFKILFVAFSAALAGFLFGFDTAVISGTIEQVKIQFENGQLDMLRLLQAEKQLEQSRYDELSARINFLQAGQKLAMAGGYYQ